MGRRLKGSVLPFAGKFRAFVGKNYLGFYETERDAWLVVRGALQLLGDKPPDTLRLVGERWFAERERDGVVRGVTRERSVWRSHIDDSPFIDYPVKGIRPDQIYDWLRELQRKPARHAVVTSSGIQVTELDRPISQQTIRHAYRVLRSCLDWAAMKRLIPSNPTREIKVPKSTERPAKERIVYLTADEIGRVFALELSEMKRAAFAVAIYGGLRAGELWGLRWEDVELDGARPHLRIRRSYGGPTKTAAGVREVPLFSFPRDALRIWRRSGGAVRGIGLVFPAPHGGCYKAGYDGGWRDKPYRVDGELKTILGVQSRAGVNDAVRFHDLRHTCASHLVMGTWTSRPLTLQEIGAILGHSSIGVTMRYAHLSPEHISSAAHEIEIGH